MNPYNVLIVAPQFSPSSYPPAQRIRLFTNHLPAFEWKPIVLAVEPEFLEEEPDWEFAKLISPDLEIIRTKALSAKWTRKIGIGDMGIRSLWHQYKTAKKVCQKRKIDLLFISGPPWHTFLVGPWIRRSFGIPYVLDYIDPWVSAMGENSTPWEKVYWFRQMAIALEPAVVRDAAHIISVSEGLNSGILSRYSFLKKENFTAIPYGAEKSDFDSVRQGPKTNRFFVPRDQLFHIVFVGAMMPKAYGTLRALFNAMKKIEKDRPDLYRRIRFHFIGTTYAVNTNKELVNPVAREMGLSDIVHEYPQRVSYFEARTLLIQANAILAFGSSEILYAASKIYPCILANQTLLAIFHSNSNVADVVREANAGELITYSTDQPVETKVEEIAAALKKITQPGYVKSKTNWQAFEKYSANNMAGKLARVFDEIVQ